MMCPICAKPMLTDFNNFRFRCAKKECKVERSMRSGSIFAHSRLKISKLVLLMFFWAKEDTATCTKHLLGVSKGAITHWYSRLQTICVQEMNNCDMRVRILYYCF